MNAVRMVFLTEPLTYHKMLAAETGHAQHALIKHRTYSVNPEMR